MARYDAFARISAAVSVLFFGIRGLAASDFPFVSDIFKIGF
jgi:hypothetical protein